MYQPTLGGAQVIVVQAAIDPVRLSEAVRREVAAMDKDLPLYRVQTMQDLVDGASAWTRSRTLLLGSLAAVALVLAAIGVYGLVSFSVSQRRHEIGIRIALGATRGDVIAMTLRDSSKLIAAGLVLGVAGAFGLTRYLSALLFEVKAADPLTFAAVPLFLAPVALAASCFPALRATAIDPAGALRHE
jgi:putative ABC transport system permease protein